MTDTALTRRRGQALESVLLEAAWQQMLEAGPVGFTFDAIAARARTSKPVLYRRWSNVDELLSATLAWQGRRDALVVPDTGNLRDDLLELLRAANRKPERFLVFFRVIASGWLRQTGLTPAALRDRYLSASTLGIDTVFRRAVARGDIGDDVLTPSLSTLPFDLFRSRMLLTLAPIPEPEITAIVDEVVMPLVTRATPEANAMSPDRSFRAGGAGERNQ